MLWTQSSGPHPRGGRVSYQHVSFDIEWHTYSNDDLADDLPPDEGWYVTINAPDGSGGALGPDHFGSGFATVEEALTVVEKWATDRGFTYMPPTIEVTVGKQK